jgi:ABC-type phosphate transport system substrate-binding protein
MRTSIHKKQNEKRLRLKKLLSLLFLVTTTENCCGHLYKEVTKMTSLTDLKNEPQLGPKVPTSSHYAGYVQSIDKTSTPTGFLEFSPRDPKAQSKYDAMQSSWEGVESSDKAIASGAYALDYASDDRGSAPKKPLILPPAQPKPKEESWFCVVQ